MHSPDKIFAITNEAQFTAMALETFQHQYLHNAVYKEFADVRRINPEEVRRLEDIPFLPIEFFKSREVICGSSPPQGIFRSSGTTGMERSRHLVADLGLYRKSFVSGFRLRYGDPADVQFLALMPTPDQAPESSLVYMIRNLMDLSSSPENGFFLASHSGLKARLTQKRPAGKRIMLIGLAYALLDFAAKYSGNYSPLMVVETGGMKGRRQELLREELHEQLCQGYGVEQIHSEYGMTELLSQAWSTGKGLFSAPHWMKVMIRDINDPLSWAAAGVTGGVSIIDLANYNSCSFIETQDLGRISANGEFEVFGRFDAAQARGCSLMI
ncbi:MAG: acyl transferase [Bacteroidetes bacterium]|nr:acyl transferase [Bacteroidota bacterium]